MYIKSCYNWVGNKYKYLNKINEIIEGKRYERVIEPFMGSGNILLNANCKANHYIGNDNISLIPKIYSYLSNNKLNYSTKELEEIINGYNKFSDKDDYYTFRNYWNSKYTNNVYDKNFIYETALLLKMCSNSMVRFNSNGEFNQGFRGIEEKTKFFNERMKNNIVSQLKMLETALKQRRYTFYVMDFKNILPYTTPKDLLILDPPYIPKTDMYNMNFTKKDDELLLNFLTNTKSDFLYFNYLQSDKGINEGIYELLKNFKYNPLKIKEINNKSKSGQKRKDTKKVKEVIITNIDNRRLKYEQT